MAIQTSEQLPCKKWTNVYYKQLIYQISDNYPGPLPKTIMEYGT